MASALATIAELVSPGREVSVGMGTGGAVVNSLFVKTRPVGAVKEAIASGLVAGPRMLTCGWAMSQTGGHGKLDPWPYDLVEHLRPRSAFVDGPDECRKFVRRQLGVARLDPRLLLRRGADRERAIARLKWPGHRDQVRQAGRQLPQLAGPGRPAAVAPGMSRQTGPRLPAGPAPGPRSGRCSCA